MLKKTDQFLHLNYFCSSNFLWLYKKSGGQINKHNFMLLLFSRVEEEELRDFLDHKHPGQKRKD